MSDQTELLLEVRDLLRKQSEDDLVNTVRSCVDEISLMRSEVKDNYTELRRDLRGLSIRVGKLEDGAEETGRYQITELKKKLEWWQSIPFKVASFVMGSLFVAALGFLLGRIH